VRPRALDEFLRKARIPFTVFTHPAAFTAQHLAEVTHVPGRSLAKIVVCFMEEEPILAVVPAHLVIDLERLRTLAGVEAIRLAREAELAAMWPDCEAGATMPFVMDRLMRVFVDETFVGEPEMVFEAGTHTDAIRVHYWDFVELTRPVVGAFAGARGAAASPLTAV
jgi:Ala-tRNA(Pro) deacylase